MQGALLHDVELTSKSSLFPHMMVISATTINLKMWLYQIALAKLVIIMIITIRLKSTVYEEGEK